MYASKPNFLEKVLGAHIRSVKCIELLNELRKTCVFRVRDETSDLATQIWSQDLRKSLLDVASGSICYVSQPRFGTGVVSCSEQSQ